MKKILLIAVVVPLVVVFLVFGIKIFTHYKSLEYENTAVPYVKMVIPEISKWDADIIRGYMATEVLAGISGENFQKIVTSLAKLGALKSFQEPEFSSADSFKTKSGVQIKIVTYKISAEYEKGAAVITIGLLENGSSFQVHNFNVNPEALNQ